MRTMRSWRAAAGLTLVPALLAACATSAALTGSGGDRSIGERMDYPYAPRVEQFDDYHGVLVADPYRWLENTDSEATRLWVKLENELTFDYLARIPARKQLSERLTQLWDYERYGVPFKQGGRYFFSKNNGLQNQSVLYTAASLDEQPRVLLDPNSLSDDGTVALGSYSVSEDGKLMAYGLQSAGSDWVDFHVRDVETGADLGDHLTWIKFSGASWTNDGEGFFYSSYPQPGEGRTYENANYYQKLRYHRLGDDQSQDAVVYERPDQKEWGFGGQVTEDGDYLVINVWRGSTSENGIFYMDLTSSGGEVVELLNEFDAQYTFLGNDGPVFWFRTDLDAPNGRVIAIDVRSPERRAWRELIPESDDAMRSTSVVNDTFIASYLHDAHSMVKLYSLTGDAAGEIELPGIGTARGFGGKRAYDETFYAFTGYTTPTTVYRYDMKTGASEVYRRPTVDFNPDNYVTKQVFYRSKDGTRIPMFITHKKGIVLDGQNPTYLYGYGGFDIAITPSFNVSYLVWMEMGGVVAVANLRGGGEYGKAWHDAGRLFNKQNVFDDFIAAAEYMIDEGYTSTPKLAIGGRSNGGLLVGACMTQRPDLFGACLPGVGVMDMLRFHKFTIGWAWVSDYGSSDNAEDFKNLYSYSPLHNINDGVCYPPTFIVTADHDDRVVPGHSFKYTATLQRAQGCDNPVLIRIETKAGHGGGKPTSKRIEERTDEWAFLTHVLGMDTSLLGGD